jgi:hypothetical protein
MSALCHEPTKAIQPFPRLERCRMDGHKYPEALICGALATSLLPQHEPEENELSFSEGVNAKSGAYRLLRGPLR